MTQSDICRGVQTSVCSTSFGISVYYRGTEVARKEGNTITLNSGGWETVTTKRRMNQFSNQFCQGRFQVYQQH